jgi:putative endonuclease
MEYYYIYVLHSLKVRNSYAGHTKYLKLRFEQHQKGLVHSTKHRRPLELIYFEACQDQEDATKKEKYLKTHYVRMYLKNRLSQWYNSSNLIS